MCEPGLWKRRFHFVNSRHAIGSFSVGKDQKKRKHDRWRLKCFIEFLASIQYCGHVPCSMTQVDILLLEQGKMMFCSAELPVYLHWSWLLQLVNSLDICMGSETMGASCGLESLLLCIDSSSTFFDTFIYWYFDILNLCCYQWFI